MLDRYPDSLEVAKAAAELSRVAGDKLGEANALRSQAGALHMLERFQESLEAAKVASAESREAGSKLAKPTP